SRPAWRWWSPAPAARRPGRPPNRRRRPGDAANQAGSEKREPGGPPYRRRHGSHRVHHVHPGPRPRRGDRLLLRRPRPRGPQGRRRRRLPLGHHRGAGPGGPRRRPVPAPGRHGPAGRRRPADPRHQGRAPVRHLPDRRPRRHLREAAGVRRRGPAGAGRPALGRPGLRLPRPLGQPAPHRPGLTTTDPPTDRAGEPMSESSTPTAAHAADRHDVIRVIGARANNLKGVSVEIPKRRLTVFTGVSGSGKSSLVFGTIAAESQRLINETYSAFLQGFMPTVARPEVDVLEGLTTAIVVDQERLASDPRSTVGTVTDANARLRILFSRLGKPHVGSPQAFSFNVASVEAKGVIRRGGGEAERVTFSRAGGMCTNCEGRG